jgi:hypothetical protein
MDKIHKHDYYSKLTLDWNQVFKYILFIGYFLTPLTLNILLHLALFEEIIYLRIFYGLLVFCLYFAIFIVKYICTSLSSSAHDFTSDLYAFLSNKRIIIPVEHRLKISAFVEKLSGSVIGYYCYDFFPLTSYAFYEYILMVSANYFLMSNLIFND